MVSAKAKGTLREWNVVYKLHSFGWNAERVALGRCGEKELHNFILSRFGFNHPLQSSLSSIKPIDIVAWKTAELTESELLNFLKKLNRFQFPIGRYELLDILKEYDKFKMHFFKNNLTLLFINVTKRVNDITLAEIRELVRLSALYNATPVQTFSPDGKRAYVFKNLINNTLLPICVKKQ